MTDDRFEAAGTGQRGARDANFETHPRSAGPPIVTAGPATAPAVLVLDPAGAAKHEEIPPPWHHLTRQRHVAWCRMPAGQALTASAEVLADLADRHQIVDVVTSGPDAELALDFVLSRAGAVRALLLVDPAAAGERFTAQGEDAEDTTVPGQEASAETADALWEQRYRDRIAEVEEAGVAVLVVAHSPGGARDQVEPPMPLGHPDLVDRVTTVIGQLDADEPG